MVSPLAFGFVLGLQHAFEPDHLAAMSSLIAGKTGVRRLTGHGVVWGLGHLLTLALVGGLLLFGKIKLDEKLSGTLTLAAGAMLVALGLHVLYRLLRDRIHFHIHDHAAEETRHLHAHSHKAEALPHGRSPHDHDHARSLLRPLAVGVMHGLAGSGAMAVLAAATADSTMTGMIFLLLFGIGSVIGMAAMSVFLAVPLTLTARSLTLANRCLQAGAGIFSLVVGTAVISEALTHVLAG
jgi:ABC-type nickel/cobalt efflux system permease component RcnA